MVTEARDAAHAELNEELNAFLDGQLDAARRAALEEHLTDCGVCQADLEDLRVTRALLRAQPLLRAPRPFAIVPEPERTTTWTRVLTWGWRVGSLATAACLAFTLMTARPETVREFSTSASSGSAALSKAVPSQAQAERSGAGLSADQSARSSANQAAAPARAPSVADAPASAPAPGQAQASAEPARPPASTPPPRWGPWAVVSVLLAAASAALFGLDRRARAG